MKIKQAGEELLEEMRAVARGDRLAPPRPAAATLSVLTAEAFALLSAMANEKPVALHVNSDKMLELRRETLAA